MAKYRIKETVRGKFYIQRKGWFFWHDIGYYEFNRAGVLFHVRYYDTLDAAKAGLVECIREHATRAVKEKIVFQAEA